MANPNNFLLDSDYPMDKIVFLGEFEIEITSLGEYGYAPFYEVIPHHLGAIPFCNGVFSIDNWQTTYQVGAAIVEGDFAPKTFNLGSDANNIYISGTIDQIGTLKARVWGVFDESTTLGTVADPTSGVTDFILNSDYNYPRLVKNGLIDATEGTSTVNHNLGYVPFCDVWYYSYIFPQTGGSPIPAWIIWHENTFDPEQGMDAVVKVDTTKLSLNGYEFYYRIYGNDTTI